MLRPHGRDCTACMAVRGPECAKRGAYPRMRRGSDVTERADPPRRRSRRHDGRVVGLICGGHFFSHFYMLLLPPLFPLLKGEFDVSFTALGATLTAFSIASGAAQYPARGPGRPDRGAGRAGCRSGHPVGGDRTDGTGAERAGADRACLRRRARQQRLPPGRLLDHRRVGSRASARARLQHPYLFRPCWLGPRADCRRRAHDVGRVALVARDPGNRRADHGAPDPRQPGAYRRRHGPAGGRSRRGRSTEHGRRPQSGARAGGPLDAHVQFHCDRDDGRHAELHAVGADLALRNAARLGQCGADRLPGRKRGRRALRGRRRRQGTTARPRGGRRVPDRRGGGLPGRGGRPADHGDHRDLRVRRLHARHDRAVARPHDPLDHAAGGRAARSSGSSRSGSIWAAPSRRLSSATSSIRARRAGSSISASRSCCCRC